MTVKSSVGPYAGSFQVMCWQNDGCWPNPTLSITVAVVSNVLCYDDPAFIATETPTVDVTGNIRDRYMC